MHKAGKGNFFDVYAPYYMEHHFHYEHGASIPPNSDTHLVKKFHGSYVMVKIYYDLTHAFHQTNSKPVEFTPSPPSILSMIHFNIIILPTHRYPQQCHLVTFYD
jgi:hypothetical protein